MSRLLLADQSPRRLFGVTFPTPVGLAAGMDKDGVALKAWPAMGFGFTEVGTVTAHAQPGNESPRLFRLRGSRAIVNRMGFNNAGAAALADRLTELGPLPTPLGILARISKRPWSHDSRPSVVSRPEVTKRYQPSAQLPACSSAEMTR